MLVNLQAVAGLLIAALGGLAVGLEREWSGHASGPKSRFAGVRTFTLLGAFSGLSGWLWSIGFQSPATVFLLGASALIVSAYARASKQDVDATTEVAALVVIAAGFIAAIGGWSLAGGVIAITTLLLVEKSRLHEIASSLDDKAVRAAVRFSVMAIVILPLLPEGPFGPWGGIRPRTLWLVVLLFSGLSFLGYLVRRTVRSSSGYSVAGMIGGAISSTAVSFSFSRLSQSERNAGASLANGVIAACTVLFLRVAIATTVLNPALARAATSYFVVPFAVGAVLTAVGMWSNAKAKEPKEETDTGNPLQFWTSLQMAGVFQGVFYLVHALSAIWGNNGLLASGAIVGFTDVDALVLSMARSAQAADLKTASQALVIGILSNTLLKLGVVLSLGRHHFRWLASGGLLLIAATLVASFFFFGK
jgi:uncharacterized membrane protein (DUF4010 family)